MHPQVSPHQAEGRATRRPSVMSTDANVMPALEITWHACNRTDAQSPAGRVTVGVKSSPHAKDPKVEDPGALRKACGLRMPDYCLSVMPATGPSTHSGAAKLMIHWQQCGCQHHCHAKQYVVFVSPACSCLLQRPLLSRQSLVSPGSFLLCRGAHHPDHGRQRRRMDPEHRICRARAFGAPSDSQQLMPFQHAAKQDRDK